MSLLYWIDILLLTFFIGHGFCDFIPLFKSFNLRVFSLYILIIFFNIYLHYLSSSISSLIFLTISSIHFSGDFKPRKELKLPGLGFFIIGLPAIIYSNEYTDYFNYLEISYPNAFLFLFYSGAFLSVIEPIFTLEIKHWLYCILAYTYITLFFGVKSIFYYMTFYHLPVSLYELQTVYSKKYVFIILILGSFLTGCFMISIHVCFTLEQIIAFINNNKNIVFGGLFGLLNSHSLTTLLWRIDDIDENEHENEKIYY